MWSPHDKRLFSLIQSKNVIADYHNCGRVTALLEGMAETGADVLEPLTPPVLNGDIELADAKLENIELMCKEVARYGSYG